MEAASTSPVGAASFFFSLAASLNLQTIQGAWAALQAAKEKKKDAAPTGDVEAASIEELHQKIQTLEKENNKEEEYRNYMQLERVSSGQQRMQAVKAAALQLRGAS
eukprot:GHUV01050655.1.p4 GENE.GHUV01050655.1~~GHUV01050655.1.p4  ORF type:complete len:106 (-),score=44.38 GHUV01050655.1:111-428(-)